MSDSNIWLAAANIYDNNYEDSSWFRDNETNYLLHKYLKGDDNLSQSVLGSLMLLDHIVPSIQQVLENSDYTDSVFNKKISNDSSTSSFDINSQNELFLDFMKKQSESFIRSLLHTDFEDGVESEISYRIGYYLKNNRLVTYNWFNYIYSNYQDNAKVIAGLLRIIGQIDINNEVDSLLPLVICGLNHKESMAQEAAIMVIEKWRTTNCLKALKNVTFSSAWIEKYAQAVVCELEKECQ